ncbi:MAG: L,D-transpeptidase [Chitinophagales bacterium]
MYTLLMWLSILPTVVFGKPEANSAASKKVWVYISKSEHRLELRTGNQTLKSYYCVFGTNPTADKMQQGDRCTPEGVFHIRAKYPHAAWHKFLWIDYPNAQSWKKFEQRKRNGSIGHQADIGGEIGIHGTPDDRWVTRGENWTWGCISLRNSDIEEIYKNVEVGAPVVIVH